MISKSVLLILFASIFSVVTCSVIDLDESNFEKVIDGSKPALVEFYASWCGHCKSLAPVYEELGEAYNHAKDKVVIARIDADKHRSIGTKYGIQGFPTLKWFEKGEDVSKPQDYQGGRALNDFVAYIKDKTGVGSNIKEAQKFVVDLDDTNFDSIVLDESKNVLVEFYAPWCGHCKNLAPIYDKVGRDFATSKNCVVAKLDATNAPLAAKKYEIQGYPTIKFFPKGSDKKPIDYPSGRTEEDFVLFLNEQCGVSRAVGGGVDTTTGRIPELDKLATKFADSTDDAVKGKIAEQAKEVAGKNKSNKYANYYFKVMEKLLSDPEYAEKEQDRLSKILGSADLTPQKSDDFLIRKNILSVFWNAGASDAASAEADDEL